MKKYQAELLIVSSLIFYSFERPLLVLLLLFSALLNVFVSHRLAFGKIKYRKLFVTAGVVLNLSIIAFFKYGPLAAKGFFTDTSNGIGHFLTSIPLPIGISFFTFEGISLLVDVYREKDLKNKNLVDVSFPAHAKKTLFFISFFPHLVSGPILKAHDFYPQIRARKFNDIDWNACFRALVVGYFLKMVCADNLKDFTFWLTFPYCQARSTFDLIAMLFGYSFQIFADFAGYSLIAIGLAKLFGYDFQQNFNFPYISTSFKEFWKRWHISLSSFLMEYLYFPLGGNRKGKARTYLNLIITMVLGGLWHGAAWSYAIWGAFHAGALVVEKFITEKIQWKPNKWLQMMKGLTVFLFITFAWLLFKLPDFQDVLAYFTAVTHNIAMPDDINLQANILLYSLPVVIYHLTYLLRDYAYFNLVRRTQYVYYSLMLFLIITNSGSAGTFVYFQF